MKIGEGGQAGSAGRYNPQHVAAVDPGLVAQRPRGEGLRDARATRRALRRSRSTRNLASADAGQPSRGARLRRRPKRFSLLCVSALRASRTRLSWRDGRTRSGALELLAARAGAGKTFGVRCQISEKNWAAGYHVAVVFASIVGHAQSAPLARIMI